MTSILVIEPRTEEDDDGNEIYGRNIFLIHKEQENGTCHPGSACYLTPELTWGNFYSDDVLKPHSLREAIMIIKEKFPKARLKFGHESRRTFSNKKHCY